MSLALVQDYSSDEEEPDKTQTQWSDSENDECEKNNRPTKLSYLSHAHAAAAAASSQEGSSSLPSALHAFNEVTGPPSFLNNSVFEPIPARPAQKKKPPLAWQSEKNDQSKKDKRTVAVVEAKAQLVGVHDRVRSDLTGSLPKDSAALLPTPKNLSSGSAKTVGAALPPPEDAAELLRMCQQCGVPKTYSNAKGGMVCPICRDHQVGISEKEKKKGSTIKDKEKCKRMKGQSSHATWKSETEMQLRQQYD